MTAIFAVSLGDPAGIGPEIIAKSWDQRDTARLPPFFAIGDPDALSAIWTGPIGLIEEPGEAARLFPDRLPVLRISEGSTIWPGRPDPEGARSALHSLEMAVGLARSGSVQGVITGPISKVLLQQVGFTHPGQTEFTAERCGVSRNNIAMLLAGPSLKVVPITGHIPLTQVARTLSTELIVNRAHAAAKGMTRNFGIANPRIAIAGLNPHAGEDGTLGHEEQDIIAPAIEQLLADGLDVSGPLAADSMFHDAARRKYDVALCQYHDQALIPLKALHFECGVNMTLGLPIVRTSPDHGTAFNIAGQDIADPSSMIAAIQMAETAWSHRQNYDG
ncbi:MAG: 4-hydroxythreonine-4-phosphate dehydrogenase PdxA [Blastomonas sp.]